MFQAQTRVRIVGVDGEEKAAGGGRRSPEEIKKLFDSIAGRYDQVNNMISLGAVVWWRVRALKALSIPEGASVLDVGTGTGWIPRYLLSRRPDLKVTGTDISEGMLEIARERCPQAGFVVGDATALPFGDASFDVVTCTFVLRNVEDRRAALAEMARVLKAGGTLMLLDTFAPRKGSFWRSPMRLWLRNVMPFLASLRSDKKAYDYLAESILDFSERGRVFDELERLGCSVQMLELGFDTALCFLAEKR